jgi:hypothetical protein
MCGGVKTVGNSSLAISSCVKDAVIGIAGIVENLVALNVGIEKVNPG